MRPDTIQHASYDVGTLRLRVVLGDGTERTYLNVGVHCWAVWQAERLSYIFWRDRIDPAYLTETRMAEIDKLWERDTSNASA